MKPADFAGVPAGACEVFEPLGTHAPIVLRQAHNEIHFYTWGNCACCLPNGATRATRSPKARPGTARTKTRNPRRRRQRAHLPLKVGDVLIFEEVIGPTTGNPADADPAHRHAVWLTKVAQAVDGLSAAGARRRLGGQDALPFSLCLSALLPAPDCRCIDDVSVARGNVVLVDHGRGTRETIGPVPAGETTGDCACDGSVIESATLPERFYPELDGAPLTFAQPLPGAAPASMLMVQDPRLALPQVGLQEYVGAVAGGATWNACFDLLDSGADDRLFVAEIDDAGAAHLRFGDGEMGRMPDPNSAFQASYRLGNGPAGNVGRETITYLVLRTESLSADSVEPRNPMPAQGGTAPEPVAEVKLFAPGAFRARRERAITAGDYAELAQNNAQLQRAAAELRWMGSWYEAQVAIDPLGTETADAALRDAVAGYLFQYRRMGHDVAVVAARYVPVDVTMEVCVLPDYARGAVKAELLKVFGIRRLADGSLGFFHPDNLSFGDGVYVSRLIAAAKNVAGVDAVRLLKLVRQDDSAPPAAAPPGTGVPVPTAGALPMAGVEIAQCDNDPDFPEHGKLEFILRGGL